jgi:spore coat polysaccharide biosynthesis predicted glycosyltransferase SpsG
VAKLIASCDLAIMAGGTTIYEAAYCGLPMILVAIAHNQIYQSKVWGARPEILYLGTNGELTAEKLLKAFFYFYNNPKLYNYLENENLVVDSKGAKRVCENILEILLP